MMLAIAIAPANQPRCGPVAHGIDFYHRLDGLLLHIDSILNEMVIYSAIYVIKLGPVSDFDSSDVQVSIWIDIGAALEVTGFIRIRRGVAALVVSVVGRCDGAANNDAAEEAQRQGATGVDAASVSGWWGGAECQSDQGSRTAGP